jgi:hypothetical protein
MKYVINEKYRRNVHYVWCSESFDSSTLSSYVSGSLVAPTSNPKDIFMDLRKAVDATDRHNTKIKEQILGLSARAVTWEADGEISTFDKNEIIYMVNEPSYFKYWKPLLYVIPRPLVESRLEPVSAALCASLGNEYIIRDLHRDEFDLIEL